MIKFTIPLVPASFAMFSIHFTDRFFVQRFCEPDDLGMYSLGYKFGMIISFIISQPFFRIWNTQRFEIAKQENPGPTLSRFFSYYALIVFFVGLGISVFSKEIIQIMAPDNYANASGVIAFIVLSYIFSGMATFFTIGTMVTYQTRYTAYIQTSVAAFNILLNFILIPRFGILGAAYSTLITFFTLWLITMLNSQRLYYIPLELRRLGSLLLSVCIIFVVSIFIDQSFIVSLASKISLMMLFPVFLWLFGFVQPDEWARIKELPALLKGKILQLRTDSAKP